MSKCLKQLKAIKQKQRESDVSKKYLGGELEKVFEGTDIKNNSVFLDAQKNKPFISEKSRRVSVHKCFCRIIRYYIIFTAISNSNPYHPQ